jgi:hypothetical protein
MKDKDDTEYLPTYTGRIGKRISTTERVLLVIAAIALSFILGLAIGECGEEDVCPVDRPGLHHSLKFVAYEPFESIPETRAYHFKGEWSAGEAGVILYTAIMSIEGVSRASWGNYTVTVTIGKLYSWDRVHLDILTVATDMKESWDSFQEDLEEELKKREKDLEDYMNEPPPEAEEDAVPSSWGWIWDRETNLKKR